MPCAAPARALSAPLWLLALLSYLDRCNLSFVSGEVQASLGLSDTQYGVGAGVFFVGYVAFQLPSNVALGYCGARNWLAALAVAWGVACCAMAGAYDADSFYRARFW